MSRADGDPRMLERLRGWRVPDPPDRSIDADVTRLVREVSQRQRAVGGMDRVWAATVPAELAANCRIDRLTKGGDLHVFAQDAASRYALDLWLRSGGLDKLRAASGRGIRSIKLK